LRARKLIINSFARDFQTRFAISPAKGQIAEAVVYGGTYRSCRDLDANLLDGFGELVRLDGSVIIQIEIFECLHENGLLALGAASLLHELVLEFSFETSGVSSKDTYLVLRCSIFCVSIEVMVQDNVQVNKVMSIDKLVQFETSICLM
jgi:hypothetical protein